MEQFQILIWWLNFCCPLLTQPCRENRSRLIHVYIAFDLTRTCIFSGKWNLNKWLEKYWFTEVSVQKNKSNKFYKSFRIWTCNVLADYSMTIIKRINVEWVSTACFFNTHTHTKKHKPLLNLCFLSLSLSWSQSLYEAASALENNEKEESSSWVRACPLTPSIYHIRGLYTAVRVKIRRAGKTKQVRHRNILQWRTI